MTNEYAAGFFDGEGSISIACIQRKSRNPEYHIRIQMSNTDLSVLEKFKEMFAGQIYLIRKRNPNHTQAWKWSVGTAQSMLLLEQLLPHLVIKKKQAQLALEFRDHQLTFFRNQKFLTKEEVAFRRRSQLQMMHLNGRYN